MDFIFTKRNLNLLCIIISICIYLLLICAIPKSNNIRVSARLIEIENSQEIVYDTLQSKWSLEIPKINLNAPISEGTDEETLNKYIGHFEETAVINGNIGLAGHNRGYRVNYFANIKELKKGDKIFYTYNGKRIEFKVDSFGIIAETDWTKLEKTEDIRLTLITCVENEPTQRRFVQAIVNNMEEVI